MIGSYYPSNCDGCFNLRRRNFCKFSKPEIRSALMQTSPRGSQAVLACKGRWFLLWRSLFRAEKGDGVGERRGGLVHCPPNCEFVVWAVKQRRPFPGLWLHCICHSASRIVIQGWIIQLTKTISNYTHLFIQILIMITAECIFKQFIKKLREHQFLKRW